MFPPFSSQYFLKQLIFQANHSYMYSSNQEHGHINTDCINPLCPELEADCAIYIQAAISSKPNKLIRNDRCWFDSIIVRGLMIFKA